MTQSRSSCFAPRLAALGVAWGVLAAPWANAATTPPSDAPVAVLAPPSRYPGEQELLPVWMSLLRMREADVYKVGPPVDARLLDQARDTSGIVAGCPVVASAHVTPGSDWLDSLSQILADPKSYRREAQMQLAAPTVVIRMRGDEDSLLVTVGPDYFLRVVNAEGFGMVGWLERDSGKLASLIDAAFGTSPRVAKKGSSKTAGARP